MEAFQREVYVMNCLRHPNVVLLLGACQTPPKLAIIMEYVAGGSLHQVQWILTALLLKLTHYRLLFIPPHTHTVGSC